MIHSEILFNNVIIDTNEYLTPKFFCEIVLLIFLMGHLSLDKRQPLMLLKRKKWLTSTKDITLYFGKKK